MNAEGQGVLRKVLSVRNISIAYGNQKALNGVSLDIRCGQITALIGSNGAGKSSLVKAICGRIGLAEGDIILNGKDATARAARGCLGVAPQKAALYDYLTARENLICFGRQAGLDKNFAATRADEILIMTGMDQHAQVRACAMSGGMRQRINIGAAIMHHPALVILDEPSAGLDPAGMRQVDRLITQLKSEGYAILVITHDMVQASQLADQIVVLKDGQVAAQGSPEHLIKSLCGSDARLWVTSNDQRLRDHGFSRNDPEEDYWQKTLSSPLDAPAVMTRLHQEKIAFAAFTLTTATLDDALAAMVSPDKELKSESGHAES